MVRASSTADPAVPVMVVPSDWERPDRSGDTRRMGVLLQQRLRWLSTPPLILVTPSLIRRDELPFISILNHHFFRRWIAVVFDEHLREFVAHILQHWLDICFDL